MNTTKAMKTTAPPKVLAALGLGHATTIGAALDYALRLLQERQLSPNLVEAAPSPTHEKEDFAPMYAKLLAPDQDDDRAAALVLRLVTTSAVATAEEMALLRRRGWVPVAQPSETPGNGLME